MDTLLNILQDQPSWLLWLLFGAENAGILLVVLAWGHRLQRKYGPPQTMARRHPFAYNARQWRIALLTTVLNTAITYAGYWLWTHGAIRITTTVDIRIIGDALFLFFAMDLLMFLFHFLIHKTPLYRWLHALHHEAVDPEPIDLFILHPVETLCFGALWLFLLLWFPLNIYGMILYLVINVIFGMMGHLGMEPLPEKVRQWPVLKYLGTSSFHHTHHRDEQSNFGFYTSIWDRVFRTYHQK